MSQGIRSYGIKAGYVSATQTWETTAPYSYPYPLGTLPGVDAGLFVEWLNMPIASIITEVHYIQKGVDAGKRLRVEYVSVPILAKARFSDPPFIESPFSLYVFAGPRIDVLMNTRAGGFSVYFDNLKKTDYGATLGGGLEFSYVGSHRVGFEFRYSPSLTDSYSMNYTKMRNHSLEFLLVLGM